MSTAALLCRQFRFERRLFWRNHSEAFFNFLLPLLFLVLVASAYGSDSEELDVLIPGIAGMAIMATTFTALAFNITFLREEGVLKRVRGTPLPAGAYFGGLLLNSVVNAVVQIVLVVVIGHVLYDVGWPRDWASLALFSALGVVCFGALGVALSHAIPNFDSAPAYTNAVFLPAIFISGVFYSSESMPRVLEVIADVLPLKHVIDGMHAGIVTGAGLGSTLDSLAILVAWGAFGAWVVLRRFRWDA